MALIDTPAEGPARPRGPASFVAGLERRFAAAPPEEKRLRTRERLRIATARMLEDRGYHHLRVADVAQAADTSTGAFYIYYRHKTDAALQVLWPFVTMMFDRHAGADASMDAGEALRSAFARCLAVFRDNAGLLRALDQVVDEVPRFDALVERYGLRWHRRLARRLVGDAPGTPARQSAADLSQVLASMTAGLARRMAHDPEFALAAQEDMADRLSEIWLRSLYLDPAPSLGAAAALRRRAGA